MTVVVRVIDGILKYVDNIFVEDSYGVADGVLDRAQRLPVHCRERGLYVDAIRDSQVDTAVERHGQRPEIESEEIPSLAAENDFLKQFASRQIAILSSRPPFLALSSASSPPRAVSCRRVAAVAVELYDKAVEVVGNRDRHQSASLGVARSDTDGS